VSFRRESAPDVEVHGQLGKAGKENQDDRLKQRFNAAKPSDPSFFQDPQFLLALPDGQSISDEALEGHQSSLLTAQPRNAQQHRAMPLDR
jgi:hypothetical protein